MKTLTLNTEDAGYNARGAAINADMLNNKHKHTYTMEQQRKAITARDLLDTAYSYSKLYINYRSKFIAIKLEGARAKDSMARQVETLFAELGYTKAVTAQGTIYRIMRVV